MQKIALFYLTSCAAFILGLIAVLKIGARLTAPPDLRGRWTLTWGDANSDSKVSSMPSNMVIAQSGTFVDIQMEDAKLSGRLQQGANARTFEGELGTTRQRISLKLPEGVRVPTTFAGEMLGAVDAKFVAHKLVTPGG